MPQQQRCQDCPRPATKRLAVWADDDSRVTDRMPWACDEHADPLLATGNATVVTTVEPSGCAFVDTGNGPCGGPSNGLYCWDHKDLR